LRCGKKRRTSPQGSLWKLPERLNSKLAKGFALDIPY
jgi:hypothetical protein